MIAEWIPDVTGVTVTGKVTGLLSSSATDPPLLKVPSFPIHALPSPSKLGSALSTVADTYNRTRTDAQHVERAVGTGRNLYHARESTGKVLHAGVLTVAC
jgi:hypothetical protein